MGSCGEERIPWDPELPWLQAMHGRTVFCLRGFKQCTAVRHFVYVASSNARPYGILFMWIQAMHGCTACCFAVASSSPSSLGPCGLVHLISLEWRERCNLCVSLSLTAVPVWTLHWPGREKEALPNGNAPPDEGGSCTFAQAWLFLWRARTPSESSYRRL
jgi:hypothetical protein